MPRRDGSGAPGLHFFTFNEHAAVLDVLDQLDLPLIQQPFLPAPERTGIRLKRDLLRPARMRPPKFPKSTRGRPRISAPSTGRAR